MIPSLKCFFFCFNENNANNTTFLVLFILKNDKKQIHIFLICKSAEYYVINNVNKNSIVYDRGLALTITFEFPRTTSLFLSERKVGEKYDFRRIM